MTRRPDSRVAQRQEDRRRRRQRQAAVGFTVVLFAVVGVGRIVRHAPAPAPLPASAAVPATSRSAAFVLVHRGGDGNADLIGVVSAFRRQAAVLLVPSSTLVEMPSFDVKPLGESLRFGGPRLLRIALANASGIDVGPVVVVDDAQLSNLLRPSGTLAVRGGTRSSGPGAVDVSTDDAVQRLVDRGGARERDHFVDVQAVLSAWFRALGQTGVADATLAQVPPLDPSVALTTPPDTEAAGIALVLRTVAGRGAIFDTLAVEPADVGTAGESYLVKHAPLDKSVAKAFTGRQYPQHRVRVEILNGTGEVGLAQRVAAKLVPAGFEVVLTNNARSFDHAQTTIASYDRKKEPAARAIQQLLHAGALKHSEGKVTVADVTIVVGSDFR